VECNSYDKGVKMRYLAILFNLLLLGMVIFFCVTEGVPSGGDDFVWFMLMTLAPVFSLIAIFGSKGNNLLSLYLKRKALEEKRKIDQLSGDKGN
jgi:hypothetical protein